MKGGEGDKLSAEAPSETGKRVRHKSKKIAKLLGQSFWEKKEEKTQFSSASFYKYHTTLEQFGSVLCSTSFSLITASSL